MPVFLLKSLLSIPVLLLALIAMFTMFEIFGRTEKRYNIEKLKKIHKINGIIYVVLFLIIAFFCLKFIADTKTDLSPRVTFHGIFAISIIILLCLKVSFIRIYRQFYEKVKTMGILIAFMTFVMIGISGGYYLLITKFGTDIKTLPKAEEKKEAAKKESKWIIRADADSICKGKELYESKCYFCHDAYSNKTEVGPGHKGILKNQQLPVSKKPATPENIASQILRPYKDMPAFSYMSDEQVQNIIAFLNTL